MLQDTCTQECKFYKKYSKGKSCPFYVQTAWENEKRLPYWVNDCANKRSVYMQQEVLARLLALQKASEQERNAQHLSIKQMAFLTQAAVPSINVLEAMDVLDVDPQKLLPGPKE